MHQHITPYALRFINHAGYRVCNRRYELNSKFSQTQTISYQRMIFGG